MDGSEGRARAAIDGAHRHDSRTDEGAPRELVYADRLEAWVRKLREGAGPILILAARAQHLERWAIPRESYPKGRSGYLRWRADVHRRQGERVRELLAGAGCEESLTLRVAELVAKTAAREDPDAQVLEDAACLVFLETELGDFIHVHPRDKTVEVLRKTWRKMSEGGRRAALALALPDDATEIVREALS
jgi:hypothetical protein